MKNNDNESDMIPAGYTRVTEIFSPYKDFDNVNPEVLANACARGTKTHEFCDLYALNMLIEKPSPEVKPYFDSFKYWHDNFVEQTLMTETRINHPLLFISGQPDWIGRLKGSPDLVLVDWKTPRAHELAWRLQMAAYRLLLREVLGIYVERRLSLRLSHEGKAPAIVEYTDHFHDERLFLNQVEIYRLFYPKIKAV